MKMNTPVHYAAKIAVDAVFYAGIAAMLFIPMAVKYIGAQMNYAPAARMILLVTLMLSGLCALFIVFNLKRMFKTLLDGNPFTEANVGRFRAMAAASLLIAAIYVIKCILLPSPMTAAVVIVFVIASLFCLTLKDLFKQAVNYKEENDLTV